LQSAETQVTFDHFNEFQKLTQDPTLEATRMTGPSQTFRADVINLFSLSLALHHNRLYRLSSGSLFKLAWYLPLEQEE
jgi:hypothetical protein